VTYFPLTSRFDCTLCEARNEFVYRRTKRVAEVFLEETDLSSSFNSHCLEFDEMCFISLASYTILCYPPNTLTHGKQSKQYEC